MLKSKSRAIEERVKVEVSNEILTKSKEERDSEHATNELERKMEKLEEEMHSGKDKLERVEDGQQRIKEDMMSML